MIIAEMAAFDNIKEVVAMADDLATFVRSSGVRSRFSFLERPMIR